MSKVTIQAISKNYDQVSALQDINLSIKSGELFGLIGPDGAGKSTLFKIISTLLIPDTGSVRIDDQDTVKDYRRLRKVIGYMPGKFSLYQDLTISENINFFATIFGTSLKENYELVKEIYVQIEPFKNRRAGKLSGGMKQKLALCCALIHKPKLLLLDEPTTGVDAVSRSEFWEMLGRLKQKGITIIVSTPYMDEASLCERIALIQKGKILKNNSPQNIITEFNKPLYALRTSETYRLLTSLKNQSFVDRVEPFGDSLHLSVSHLSNLAEVHDFLDNLGIDVKIEKITPTIEDVFLELMQLETNE